VKLHSPRFERALRRRVKKAVRESRELKREARAQRFTKHYNLVLLMRPALAIGFGIVIAGIVSRTGHPVTGLAVISLWAFAWMFIRANNILSQLYGASDLTALSLLPVGIDVVFRWQLSKCLRSSIMSLADLLAAFWALVIVMEQPAVNFLAVIPIAIVVWITVVAGSVILPARFPRIPYALISPALFMFAIALFLGRAVVGATLLAFVDRYASTLNLVLPTGWAASLFLLLIENNRWVTLGLLVPIGTLLWLVPGSLTQLRAGYQFAEVTHHEAPDLLPESYDVPGPVEPLDPQMPRRVGQSEIDEIIRSRQFFASSWRGQQGWFEKKLWQWLAPREKVLAEFVFPNGFPVSRPWRNIFRSLVIGAFAAMLMGLLGSTFQLWIIVASLFVIFCQLIAQLCFTGAAFRPIFCSGVNIPVYAAYGIGFRELSRMFFKCSFVQLPLIIACGMCCSLFIVLLAKLPIAAAIVMGFKAAGLLAASRFIFLTFSFSSGTNDTVGISLRSIALIGSIIGCGGLFLVLGGAGLFVPDAFVAWGLWVAALLDAYAFFRIYGWFYHRTRFDLMNLPRRQ
jgi:hypothetical protein